MGISTESIARACARRPWLTLCAWIVGLAMAIGSVGMFLNSTSEGTITSDPESEQGYRLIDTHFPLQPRTEWVDELIVIHSSRDTVTDPPFRQAVEGLLADVRANAFVHNAHDAYEGGDRSGLCLTTRTQRLSRSVCRVTVKRAPRRSDRSPCPRRRPGWTSR